MAASGRPVVFVPVADQPARSSSISPRTLAAALACARRACARCWSTGARPRRDERELDIAGHVETLLLPLIDALGRAAGAGRLLPGRHDGAGGGVRDAGRRALALIAAPWRFAGFGDAARAEIADAVAAARSRPARRWGWCRWRCCRRASGGSTRRARSPNIEAFGRLEPGSRGRARFVALEDWANAGAPLTYAAGRELFERFLRRAIVPGRGRWTVGGARDRSRARSPARRSTSSRRTDRIVPAASAAGLADAPRSRRSAMSA